MIARGDKKPAGNGRAVGRSAQAGMLVAAAAAAKSFERTLMPRKTTDQGMVTGLSVALAYATTAIFQDVIENVASFLVRRDGPAEEDSLRRATMMADLGAIAAGATLNLKLAQQKNESLGRAGMRTTGYFLTYAGTAGFSVGFLQDLLDIIDPREGGSERNRTLGVAVIGGGVMALIAEYKRRRRERAVSNEEIWHFRSDEWNVQAGRSLLTAGGISAVLIALAIGERAFGELTGKALERGLSGNRRFWQLAGHFGALAGLGALAYAGLDRVYQDIESGTGKIEPAFHQAPDSPYVSGSPESVVDWATMGREGRRHVLTVLSPQAINDVMGIDDAVQPIRVFVGLESAPTEIERIALAIDELKRTGAFDRKLLVAVSPTGTGYVNYAAIECCEYFTHGNCATVTIQYSKRPSPLSMDRVWEGRKQFRMLLAAIRRELYKRDPSDRPRLVVFGESLGAHTSQDAFLNQGTQGLEDAGVERALWIGSPHLSKWKAQVLGEPRPDVNKSLIADVDNFEEVEHLASSARQDLRYVMITHHNDGVGLFGGDLIFQRPGWLGETDLRASSVPKWMHWVPIVTAVQTAIDMKNAMNVVPGEFVANGHDYRADLARFINEVFDLGGSQAELDRVELALRNDELERQQMTMAAAANESDPEPPGISPPETQRGRTKAKEALHRLTG
jgi:uncharacterized membrane protein